MGLVKMGGKPLSKQTRKWYYNKILKTLQLNNKMSHKEVIFQLKKLKNKKYPIDRYVINYFLRLLKQEGKLNYIPSTQKKKSGMWIVNQK